MTEGDNRTHCIPRPCCTPSYSLSRSLPLTDTLTPPPTRTPTRSRTPPPTPTKTKPPTGTPDPTESRSRSIATPSRSQTDTYPTPPISRSTATDSETHSYKYTRSTRSVSRSDPSQSEVSATHELTGDTKLRTRSRATESPSRSDPDNTTTISTTRSRTVLTNGRATASESLSRSDSAPSSSRRTPTPTRTFVFTAVTPSLTIALPAAKKPIGLSAAALRAIGTANNVAVGITGATSGAAAMTMARGIAVLSLIGCPERNPETDAFWREDFVPFPASLIPGSGFGDKSGFYHRASCIWFLVAALLVLIAGALSQETVGKAPKNAEANLMFADSDNDDDNEDGSGKKSEEKKNNKNLTGILTPNSSSPSSSPRDQSNTFGSGNDDDDADALLGLGGGAGGKKKNISNKKKKTSSSGSSSPVSSDLKKDVSATATPIGPIEKVKVQRYGRWFLSCVSAMLGLWAPQAGFVLSTLSVGDFFIALVPIAIPFIILGFFSYKVHRSLNHNPNGIYYTDSFVLERKRSVATRSESIKSFMQSPVGRFCLIGFKFWTRPKGPEGMEAQKLLSLLGNHLQKLRGPVAVQADFLSAENPFELEGEMLFDAIRENPAQADWHSPTRQRPRVTRSASKKNFAEILASYVCPHFLLLSWVSGMAAGFLQGVALGQPGTCRAISRVICAINVLSFLLAIVARPYAVPLRNIVICGMEGTFAVSAVLVMVYLSSHDEEENRSKADMAMALQIATTVVGMTGAVVMGTITVMRRVLFYCSKLFLASQEQVWASAETQFHEELGGQGIHAGSIVVMVKRRKCAQFQCALNEKPQFVLPTINENIDCVVCSD